MTAHFHDGVPCAAPTWQPEERCLATAHRINSPDGIPPRQTREYLKSAWTWPLAAFEITGRLEARLRRNLARQGKL